MAELQRAASERTESLPGSSPYPLIRSPLWLTSSLMSSPYHRRVPGFTEGPNLNLDLLFTIAQVGATPKESK